MENGYTGNQQELNMRIIWVSPHCWPDYVLRENGLGVKSQGGQTVVMYEATLALARAYPDLQIDIYARLEDGEPPVNHIHPRVRIIRLPLGPTDTYLPKERFWGEPIQGFVREIIRHASENNLRYDLVHGHYADGWYVAHHLHLEWGLPYLCSTHSLGIRKRDNSLRMGEGSAQELDLKYSFTQRIANEQAALDAAHRICPLTREEGAYMVRKYNVDPAKIRVTNNGVVVADFHPPVPRDVAALRKELDLGPEHLVILLVARVDPRKGQRELIEAAPMVIQGVREATGKTVKILFVAWVDSPLAHSLEQRADELGIRDHIIFHPPVLNKDIKRFYWAADVYSLSSSYDIFPIVMLETMAAGLPIVATRNGGPSEIIESGKDGYLVEPTNPSELAQALVRVLSSEDERERLSRAAHRKVVARYTWDKLALHTMGIYRELLGEQGR